MGGFTLVYILMKTLLSKYWLQLLFVIAGSLLFAVLIPNEEKSYLNTEVFAIRKKSNFIVIIVILILLAIIFIASIKHIKTSRQFLNFFLGIISLGLLFYLVLRPIFLFGGLALNKVSVKGTIENHYRVMHTDSNILELKNLRTGKTELIEQIIHENEKYLIKQNDTLIINFKKGLLGFNFDPTHRGNFVYPD